MTSEAVLVQSWMSWVRSKLCIAPRLPGLSEGVEQGRCLGGWSTGHAPACILIGTIISARRRRKEHQKLKNVGAGEMSQWLRALALTQGSRVQFPALVWQLITVTQVLGHPLLSVCLSVCLCTYICMHVHIFPSGFLKQNSETSQLDSMSKEDQWQF